MHDVSAQVNFSVWLANGMTVEGMGDKALQVLNEAIDAAKKSGDLEMPVQLYIAKIRALVSLSSASEGKDSHAEAKRLIEQTIAYAIDKKILGAQTELLNQAGLSLSATKTSGEPNKISPKRRELPRQRTCLA